MTTNTSIIDTGFDYIIAIVNKVDDIVLPLFGIIMLLLALKFGRGVVDAVLGMLKIKL